ncbi:nuclear transport factor 2 family protein [Pontimicrobium aquaticum]|uniref:Nuclear transport factor 2 family protein n=1 Tax=Pontimicrobium aquaticum TaxID=2565367 RepID=A0A4U0EVU1_9FLAO|nr:nuclear transport factor 2 family protein [Pontimicrobium aquaticum]TJY36041.1 nuclear transport factor 2 family protein [Pontimicrobium aquaticum]
MKRLITVLLCVLALNLTQAQTNKAGVEKACMNYIEGFYEGDTAKLKESLQPSLNKFGFWKNKDGNYDQQDYMSFEKALAYATNVKEKKQFAKPDAPKVVEVLGIGNSIAAAKVTAWWGIDYILLSKRGDKWMIEQVIWEGPLEK